MKLCQIRHPGLVARIRIAASLAGGLAMSMLSGNNRGGRCIDDPFYWSGEEGVVGPFGYAQRLDSDEIVQQQLVLPRSCTTCQVPGCKQSLRGEQCVPLSPGPDVTQRDSGMIYGR